MINDLKHKKKTLGTKKRPVTTRKDRPVAQSSRDRTEHPRTTSDGLTDGMGDISNGNDLNVSL